MLCLAEVASSGLVSRSWLGLAWLCVPLEIEPRSGTLSGKSLLRITVVTEYKKTPSHCRVG